MKKSHPHKRAIPMEQRRELRKQGKAWWINKAKIPKPVLSFLKPKVVKIGRSHNS